MFWSHKKIEESYQYLSNIKNYYNVLQLVEKVAWARYLNETLSTVMQKQIKFKLLLVKLNPTPINHYWLCVHVC